MLNTISIIVIVLITILLIMTSLKIFNPKKIYTKVNRLWSLIILFLCLGSLYFAAQLEIDSTPVLSMILISISSSVQSFVGIFDFSFILDTLNNSLFMIVFFITSAVAAIFGVINVIEIIFKQLIRKIMIKFYKTKDCLYILGETNKIESFIASIQNSDAYLSWNYKIILLLTQDQTFDPSNLTLPIQTKNIELKEGLIQQELNYKSSKEQILISLYESESTNNMLLKDVIKIDHQTVKLTAYIHSALKEFEYLDNQRDNVFVVLYDYHTITSFNFVFNHPMNYESSLDKHYIFIGFSETNRKIFSDMYSVNTTDSFDVNYTIFSKDLTREVNIFKQRLNHFLECKKHPGSYLDLPNTNNLEKILETAKEVDIFDHRFYTELSTIIKESDELTFIVNIGDDISNLKALQVLKRYIEHSESIKDCTIHVRILDELIDISNIISIEHVSINSFGILNDVYSFDSIIKQDYAMIAQSIHRNMTQSDLKNTTIVSKEQLLRDWNLNSVYAKQSNLAAVLSIRNKLREIGFDLSKDESREVSDQAYYHVLDPNHLRNEWSEAKHIDEIKRYLTDNTRNHLARLEHTRWNRFMILRGYSPLLVEELNENIKKSKKKPGKNEINNSNICITTYQGLFEYARILWEHNVSDIDYILYDYHMLDNLPKIIELSKYHIVNYKESNGWKKE